MIPIDNLDKFINLAFEKLVEHKLYLWGVYPIDNAFYMTNTITTDLRIIVGPFFGLINRHNPELLNEIDEMEDIERTIKYFIKDGGVLRFNNVSIGTIYYKSPGGMRANTEDRNKDALISAEYLSKKYPEYCTKNYSKKNKRPDIRLYRKPKI